MSAPIGKGDWVECVDAGPFRLFGLLPTRFPSGLAKGSIYCVRNAWIDRRTPFGGSIWVVTLEGVRPGKGYAWALSRFRPIYRPRQDLIETLMAPPQRVKEDA
jgi:hypothetical protein